MSVYILYTSYWHHSPTEFVSGVYTTETAVYAARPRLEPCVPWTREDGGITLGRDGTGATVVCYRTDPATPTPTPED